MDGTVEDSFWSVGTGTIHNADGATQNRVAVTVANRTLFLDVDTARAMASCLLLCIEQLATEKEASHG